MDDGLETLWSLDEEPRNILLWLDENANKRFSRLDSIYRYLSRADIFIGRIISRQYWGFLRYANPLMVGGIIAFGKPKAGYERYSYPAYIQAMARTKSERRIKTSIGEKLSPHLHVSAKVGAREYVELFRNLLKTKKIDEDELAERFDFDDEEIRFLKG